MRAVLLRSLLVIAAGSVVLAGVLYLASTVDARAPEVVEIALTQALPDDPDVALITTSIEIVFSEPVDVDGATGAIALDPHVDGSLSRSGSTVIFTPGTPLDLETAYTLTIAEGIRDAAGNSMDDAPDPYTFRTAGRPMLATSDPADGTAEVAIDAPIELVFSGLMDTASVESALELEPSFDHTLRWRGERLAIVPAEPLQPDRTYTITVHGSATDVAGVALGEAITVAFSTVGSSLDVAAIVPADGAGGISPHTSIAVRFDAPIDPDTIAGNLFTITPDVAGTFEAGAPPDDSEGARLAVFTPSAPLPPNTTFDVALAPGIATADGDRLAEPVTWSFTTGAPQATLSNHVLFLSERGGSTNVWAMNPDGTGQHQVSAELEPILEYVAAPDGSSLVVSDGRRLIHLRADGAERRVLTDTAHLEFDPAYAPDAEHVVFARADRATGELLGLWEWEVGSGSTEAVEIPRAAEPGASASDDDAPLPLRAPAWSPDGTALAAVDVTGGVLILEVEDDHLTDVDANAVAPPTWLADGGAVLVPVGEGRAARVEAPVAPFGSAASSEVVRIARSTGHVTALGGGPMHRMVTDPGGRMAWVDGQGTARVAEGAGERGTTPEPLDGISVAELVFGPVDGVLLAVIGDPEGTARRIERIDVESGERTVLATDGWEVRWLP